MRSGATTISASGVGVGVVVVVVGVVVGGVVVVVVGGGGVVLGARDCGRCVQRNRVKRALAFAFTLPTHLCRVKAGLQVYRICLGLARTINIWCIYGIFGREITEYTSYTAYMYGSGQPTQMPHLCSSKHRPVGRKQQAVFIAALKMAVLHTYVGLARTIHI